jgi:hypothetical protein
MVFIQFTKICLYVTILYNMKKHKLLESIHNISGIHIPILTNSHNWKLLLDSPFSETGW